MFHEVRYPLRRNQPLRFNILGVVTRLMAKLVASWARRVFISTPAWEPMLQASVSPHTQIRWLPVPSNVPVIDEPLGAAASRCRYVGDKGLLLGHFGTYGVQTELILAEVLPQLLRERQDVSVILIGRNSESFVQRFVRKNPELAGSVRAAGSLPPRELSLALAACDVMLQPYPDGVSTRRTSMMAALAHGRATVTTQGNSTERLWHASGAVSIVPVGDGGALSAAALRLLASREERNRLECVARRLYAEHFDLKYTIAEIRAA